MITQCSVMDQDSKTSRCQNCDQDPVMLEKCHIHVNVLAEDLETHASISNIRRVKMCRLGFPLHGI